MRNLMKYELRKSAFSKLVLLVITGIFELVFLGGLIFTDTRDSVMTVTGICGLMATAIGGIVFIGIESMLIWQKDLNTKQSYMLFLTPNNSYTILGAKLLSNAIAILLASAFFAVLAGIDVSLLVTRIGGIKELLSLLRDFGNVHIEWDEIGLMAVLGFFEGIVSWILMIVVGYLAIILSSSVFAGKKYCSLVSFVLYLIISFCLERLILFLTDLFPFSFGSAASFGIMVFFSVIASAGVYGISGYLMEERLSV